RLQVGPPGQHGDAAVSQLEQVPGGDLAAAQVVGVDGGQPGLAGVRVDGDDRRAVVHVHHGGRDQDGPVDQRATQPGQIPALPAHVAARVAAGRGDDQLEN